MKRNKLIFIIIFSISILCSFSIAECNHIFNIIEEDTLGKHYRICTVCDYKDNSNLHTFDKTWCFDDEGQYHFYKCNVEGCEYENSKSEHMGGNHDNDGICSVCGGIYQTHELDAENMEVNESSHWYICSYEGCEYIYAKEPHEETEYVVGDLTHHWYRCSLFDCSYRFEEEKHYGGKNNDGYCEFELCEKLYMAKLQIDEYQYREYKVGDKDRLVAEIVPEGIEVPKAEYKWSSSKPNVVSIDKDGNIEALREGVSIISVTYGKYTASCVVVSGELNFTVTPLEHSVYVDEIGTSQFDVTYIKKDEKTKKDIIVNINEFVDFNAFRWNRSSLKADVKEIKENKISFLGINETSEPVIFYIWLDNRLKLIDEEIGKVIKEDGKYNGKNLNNTKSKLESLEERIDTKDSRKELINIKNKLLEFYKCVKSSNEYEENEIEIIERKLLDIRKLCREFCQEVKINVLIDVSIIPGETNKPGPENTPKPGETTKPGPGNTPKPGETTKPGPGNTPKPGETAKPGSENTPKPGETTKPGPENTPKPGETTKPGPENTPKPGETTKPGPGNTPKPQESSKPGKTSEPIIEGPDHNPEAPVSGSDSKNSVNRRHICSVQGYFPDPQNPESGHLKRCYYVECEFYKKGIEGTKVEHKNKYNKDRDVEICIICYYEKGSGMTEPQIIHSRDFGIDVLQSQYLIVKDETTEIDVIITGVEKDLKIYYGPIDGELKSTEGRADENSVYLKWDVKDEYAKEALEFDFEKRDDERIITVELKDGYMQPTRTEVDLILENNFGEKRIETIELIKEAPERAQFILRFSSDVISSMKLGESKEITVICRSQYGYGEADRKEVQDYYKSKNLVDYEDIELKWEGSGGITATGASSPDSNGIAKGQVTAVSVTDNKNPAVLTIIATAKYENEDLIDEIERELKRGIVVYEVNNNSHSNNSSQTTSTSSGGNASGNNGSSLPIVAGVIGLLAIGTVVFVVGNITKG